MTVNLTACDMKAGFASFKAGVQKSEIAFSAVFKLNLAPEL